MVILNLQKYKGIMEKDILKELKTGDLVAFSGKGLFASVIKLKTNSNISHVGLILEYNGKKCIVESTTLSDIADIKTGDYRKGVQMVTFCDRLKAYDGEVYVQKLNVPIKKKGNFVLWLTDKHGKAIKYDTIQALWAGLDLFDDILESEEDESMLFCSEMVSKALQVGRVIDERINSSEETPADVCAYECFDKAVRIK